FVVAFDIEGLKIREDGQVLYNMSIELINKQGKSQFKQDSQDLEAFNVLGGNRVPAFALVQVGTDTPEGEYTLKVTVKDRAADKTEILTRRFEVVPRKFGFVQLGMTYEVGRSAPPLPAPPVAVPGQKLVVNFAVVGFDLDKSKKDQPNIET